MTITEIGNRQQNLSFQRRDIERQFQIWEIARPDLTEFLKQARSDPKMIALAANSSFQIAVLKHPNLF